MGSAELLCLALNVYFEARGEPDLGKQLVIETTLNRVADPRWPNTVCGTVYQKKQFSWTLIHKAARDMYNWEYIYTFTQNNINKKRSCVDHYHNFTVQPNWADNMTPYNVVGNHIFYCSR